MTASNFLKSSSARRERVARNGTTVTARNDAATVQAEIERQLVADYLKQLSSKFLPASADPLGMPVPLDVPSHSTAGVVPSNIGRLADFEQTPFQGPLPPRLRQTLEALACGLSEKQVAQRLSLSPHTVHAYVKALHRRLNVSSRGELLALLIRQRVATPE